MPYCRVHGLHTSQSGCPTCRYAEYGRKKAAEKRRAKPSNHGEFENLFADWGTKIGAFCGAAVGINFIITTGNLGAGLIITVICAILGGLFGAIVGGFLPYVLVLALLGALVAVILWIFDIK